MFTHTTHFIPQQGAYLMPYFQAKKRHNTAELNPTATRSIGEDPQYFSKIYALDPTRASTREEKIEVNG